MKYIVTLLNPKGFSHDVTVEAPDTLTAAARASAQVLIDMPPTLIRKVAEAVRVEWVKDA